MNGLRKPDLEAKKMAANTNILDLMAALPAWFKGPSWDTWRVVLAALFGLPLTDEQMVVFQRITGRQTPPQQAVREAYFLVGRRGGKSLISSFIAVYLALFGN